MQKVKGAKSKSVRRHVTDITSPTGVREIWAKAKLAWIDTERYAPFVCRWFEVPDAQGFMTVERS